MELLHRIRLLLISGMLVPLLTIFWSTPAWSMDDDSELLPEEEAFAFSAELLPDNAIGVRWDIADGYYMYRDKMGFEISAAGASVSVPELPPGKLKQDELFGEVDVYTGVFEMTLPLEKADFPLLLIARGQGCNEPVGVCYPPMQHEMELEPGISSTASLPATNTESTLLAGLGGQEQPLQNRSGLAGAVDDAGAVQDEGTAGGGADPVEELRNLLLPAGGGNTPGDVEAPEATASEATSTTRNNDPDQGDESGAGDSGTNEDSVAALRSLLDGGFEQPDFLPPEEAFPFSVTVVNGNTLEARFAVVEGYYLYRDKLTFSVNGDARIGGFSLPEGEEKNDEFFGLSTVYKHPFTVPINLQRTGPEAGSLTLQAGYQGCAEQGICYPPSIHETTVPLPAMIVDAAAAAVSAPADSGGFDLPGSGVDIGTGSLFSILMGALVAGLLLTFTPCVLPMIPILSGVIAGQGENLTRMRGGGLAVVYVLGTAVTYAAMGWIAGATGEQLQAYFQNAWAIGILAAIFFIMALSMFGLYEIQMPAAIQSRLQSSTSSLGGSIPLVFVLGLASALIVGACVSPILISFLGIAVTRADPVLGAQMMFVMALGMGVPLVALGFGAGYLLPRAGAWMELVKQFFGILLIAVAIYLLGVLPSVPILLLWGVFFIVISTYLGATQSLPEGASGWRRLAKGFGTVLLVWGIAALVGGFYGQRDLLQPLPARLFAGGGSSTAPAEVPHLFSQVSNLEELDREFDRAREENRGIILDYYADWCVDCVKMEKSTFQDPAVVRLIEENYIALQVDVTDPNDPGPKAVKKRFGVFGPPAVLFFDANGNPLKERNFYGYRAPDEFARLITQ